MTRPASRLKARVCDGWARWKRALLFAHPDRQFELVLGMSLSILAVTMWLAPIDALKQTSFVSFIVTVLVVIGYLRWPQKKGIWIGAFWGLWQVQATVGAYLQGGIWSTYVGYYFICSMSILITVGWRWAMATMAVTSAMIAGLAVMDLYGLIPPSQLLPSEWLWPTVSASMLIVTLGALPILAYGGRVRRIRQLNEDSARLRSVQTQLREHQNQQRQFVASVSHELRTPMTTIMGFLQSIDQAKIDSAEERAQIAIMETHANLLLDRINSLLDFSQLHANELNLRTGALHFPSLIHRVAFAYQGRAQAKGIAWQFSIDACVPEWVIGDAKRIEQVVDIVLKNAVQYTERGAIELHVVRTHGEHVQISVTDTGRGMFEPSTQILFSHLANDAERTDRAQSGTGIGLSIAQALLRLMHGSIQISATTAGGTRVDIEIPLPRASGSSASEIGLATAANGSVLMVDDSQTNRLIAKHLLKHRLPLVQFLEASSGQEGINIALKRRPSLILMDFHLPDMNGTQAARRVLEVWRDQPPVILGLTADRSHEIRQGAINAGMVDIIFKPFDTESLADCIAQHLSQCGPVSTGVS